MKGKQSFMCLTTPQEQDGKGRRNYRLFLLSPFFPGIVFSPSLFGGAREREEVCGKVLILPEKGERGIPNEGGRKVIVSADRKTLPKKFPFWGGGIDGGSFSWGIDAARNFHSALYYKVVPSFFGYEWKRVF